MVRVRGAYTGLGARCGLRRRSTQITFIISCLQSKMQTKVAEYEHLEANYNIINRRLAETTNSLQMKEQDVSAKEQQLQQMLNEVRGSALRVPAGSGGSSRLHQSSNSDLSISAEAHEPEQRARAGPDAGDREPPGTVSRKAAVQCHTAVSRCAL